MKGWVFQQVGQRDVRFDQSHHELTILARQSIRLSPHVKLFQLSQLVDIQHLCTFVSREVSAESRSRKRWQSG